MSNVLEEIIDGVETWPEAASVFAGVKQAALLSLDVGTSGIRAALFDESGRQIEGSTVKTRYPFSSDFSTFDPDELVESAKQTIDLLFAENITESRVELIAVSCFWHSLMGVDELNRPTTRVLGWADSRAAEAVQKLRSQLNENTTHQRTGCRFHASYWPAKLERLRNQEHEGFEATARWFSFPDYLVQQLCGQTAVSVSMASGTGLFDQATCEWDPELLDFFRLRNESLAAIAQPNRVFNLLPDYVLRWPQLADAQMYPAIGDGAANNAGSGCLSADKMALMIGTSGAMRICVSEDPPKQLPMELWSYRADRRRIVIGGALSDGGGLYEWIRRNFLPVEDSESIEQELQSFAPDAHGLTIMPFWSGERSTGWNPNAHGAIIGVTEQTRPIEILRATMEAIAYRFALIARVLDPLARDADVIASGNALLSSQVWPQILADVLGTRVALSAVTEASLRGAALLALEAAGKIQSIEKLPAPIGQVFEPDASNHARYLVAIERQEALYKKLYG